MRATGVVLLAAGSLALAACSPPSGPAQDARPLTPRETAFLDTLSRRSFNFFWETTDPATGLTPDRWPTRTFSSIAAVGFGLTAYVIGSERGYVSRAQARERTLATLRYFWELPQGPEPTGTAGYKGFFYHFLNYGDGLRFENVELSTIDTSLLLMGVLTCQQYFDGNDPAEVEIRALADSLYRRVDWAWARPRPPLVTMGWKPGEGFLSHDWHGYMESMMLYVLALGSPTHPVEPEAWKVWTSTYQWGEYYGQQHVGFAPLFGHQFSHAWIDFRGIQDAYMRGRGIDYFENSRRATYAQQAYAIDNPNGWTGYGELSWGLTACDGPSDATITWGGSDREFYTYSARGASFTEVRDDGTITPHAAGGSIVFAPEITVPALVDMRERFGDHLFQQYGFLDAYNETFTFEAEKRRGTIVPGVGWFNGDYLGIDVGPTLLMIENHRSGLVWELLRQHPVIRRGLERAGFAGGWLET